MQQKNQPSNSPAANASEYDFSFFSVGNRLIWSSMRKMVVAASAASFNDFVLILVGSKTPENDDEKLFEIF